MESTNDLVVGIDVGKDFSYACVLNRSFEIIRNPFKFTNSVEGMSGAIQKIKEAAGSHGFVIVYEHTNNYSGIIQRFFNCCTECIPMNPVETHRQIKISIRKIKTDKKDAISIAKCYIIGNCNRPALVIPDIIAELRTLTRTREKFVDTCASYRLILGSQLHNAYPGLSKAWPKLDQKAAKAAVRYLIELNSDADFDSNFYVTMIQQLSRKGESWAVKHLLITQKVLNDRPIIGSRSYAITFTLNLLLDTCDLLSTKIEELDTRIETIVKSIPITELLLTIPGLTLRSIAVLISEIVDITRFKSSKQLVAFVGTDPRVDQSGYKNVRGLKITKAGNSHLRRILYQIAKLSVNSSTHHGVQNPVLSRYYQKRAFYKPKNVVLVAVINKLIRYIFTVWSTKQPFVLRTPQEQIIIHFSKAV